MQFISMSGKQKRTNERTIEPTNKWKSKKLFFYFRSLPKYTLSKRASEWMRERKTILEKPCTSSCISMKNVCMQSTCTIHTNAHTNSHNSPSSMFPIKSNQIKPHSQKIWHMYSFVPVNPIQFVIQFFNLSKFGGKIQQ